MLILTRKPGESLYIGDDIKIIVVEVKGHQIRIGIEAPAHYRIYREEIYLQILEENKKAAEAPSVSPEGLEGLSAWKGIKGAAIEPKKGSGGLAIMKVGGEKKNEPTIVVKRRKPKQDDE